jgi:acyl-CoA synthetase (NDP forming)
MGFDQSQIVPINPGRAEVFGLKAYPSIADVPGEVALAVIAVNNKAVVSVVEETGRKGVKAGVIFADGFAEGGEAGKKLQQDLTAAAKAANLKLLGPNCMGFVSMRAKLGIWGGELPKSLRAGNIGCIFQSSGMMNLLMMAGAKRGLGFHVCASGGNEIVLNSADYLAYQANRKRKERAGPARRQDRARQAQCDRAHWAACRFGGGLGFVLRAAWRDHRQ